MKLKSILGTLSKAKYLIGKLLSQKNGTRYISLKTIRLLSGSVIGVIGIVVPGLIINELIRSIQSGLWHTATLTGYLALLLFVPALYQIALIPIDNILFKSGGELTISLLSEFELYVAGMDYETMEKPDIQECRERVSGTIEGAVEIVDLIGNIFSAVISFCVSFSIITYLNPLIILLTVAMVLINSYMTKWMNLKRFALRGEFSKNQRKNWEFKDMLRSGSYAKEIRLYHIAGMLLDKVTQSERDTNATTFKNNQNRHKVNFVLNITNFVQSAVVYVYLILKVLAKVIPIGSMTIYLSASQRFSGAVSSVVNSYMALSERAMEIDEWQEFLKIPRVEKTGTLSPVITADSYIEFRDVSFRYPGSDIFALKDISLKFSCIEKLCIVGENGSGKSTFIKLLLRLYEPTSGEILLDGVNITRYDYDSYVRLFAPVFQDFATYALSLKENVILAEKYDAEKFRGVCVSSNIQPLIDKLTKGADTQIGKALDPEGIELSGGEEQRIAIARACYHGGDIFILDEPTAALDPNAEYEIYTQFSNMITNKGAVLITHRLSAVQLADKVAVFSGGGIAEYGTHNELYADDGIYKEMFDKQAKFYRDDPVTTV